jgi:hypothetical protein
LNLHFSESFTARAETAICDSERSLVMRLLLVAAFVAIPAAAAAAPQSVTVLNGAPATNTANCPRTTSHLADASGLYRGKPLAPRKLTELPPGTAYMAVYRHIGGCEAPLTMVEYRNPRRR